MPSGKKILLGPVYSIRNLDCFVAGVSKTALQTWAVLTGSDARWESAQLSGLIPAGLNSQEKLHLRYQCKIPRAGRGAAAT